MARPLEDYPVDKFKDFLNDRFPRNTISLRTFSTSLGIQPGDVSRILRGQQRCGRELRQRILARLNAGEHEWNEFLPERRALRPLTGSREIILLDPYVAAHPKLQQGQRHLIRAFYRAAEREFVRRFHQALEKGDYALTADAAGRLGWLFFELGNYDEADRWVEIAMAQMTKNFGGATISEIVRSVEPRGTASLLDPGDYATQVLARIRHIEFKIVTARVFYLMDGHLRPAAEEVFRDNIAIDEHLSEPAQLSYDWDWYAVLLSSDERRFGEAGQALEKAKAHVASGSLAAAYATRAQGLVSAASGKRKAADKLRESIDAFSVLADNRGSAPALIFLAELASQRGDFEGAFRYAFAAGALDPYGLVHQKVSAMCKIVSPRQMHRALDDLRAGKYPFDAVQWITSRLVEGATIGPADLIERNVKRILPALVFAENADRNTSPEPLSSVRM